jgi:hypothetical protein
MPGALSFSCYSLHNLRNAVSGSEEYGDVCHYRKMRLAYKARMLDFYTIVLIGYFVAFIEIITHSGPQQECSRKNLS